jgi:predicted nucleic acid-binding protein
VRFWDSSAIIPLVVEQEASREAERWAAEDPSAVVWTLTRVEAVSAVRRLVREESLLESEANRAEQVLDEVLSRAHAVAYVERVKETACRLLRVHALRAADAMQLGAALAWADGSARGLLVHTLDRRLALAAEREGFTVVGATPGG